MSRGTFPVKDLRCIVLPLRLSFPPNYMLAASHVLFVILDYIVHEISRHLTACRFLQYRNRYDRRTAPLYAPLPSSGLGVWLQRFLEFSRSYLWTRLPKNTTSRLAFSSELSSIKFAGPTWARRHGELGICGGMWGGTCGGICCGICGRISSGTCGGTD